MSTSTRAKEPDHANPAQPGRFIRDPLIRAALLIFTISSVLFIGVFAYFYVKYDRIIQERFKNPVFSNSAKIYALPRAVRVGDKASLKEIASELRRTGYSEHDDPTGMGSYRLMGRRGSLEFPNLVQWAQAGGAQDWNQPIHAQHIHAGTIDPYVAQLDHFRDVIRGKTPSLQPVEDGARSLIVTLSIAEAATAGRRIDLRDRYAALESALKDKGTVA